GKSEVRSGVSHELVLNAIADCQSAYQQERSGRLSSGLLASG
ncbi:hypothetical protein MMS93_27625, partial [Escherichia coli]|nr:hypothetical protein [Escherichia coli]